MTAGGMVVGERLTRVARALRCRLTHVGRKTGQRHAVTIWFLVDEDLVYLVTADRRRQWVRNVLARRDVQLRIGSETFHGGAEPVTEVEEIARVTELLKRKYWLARPDLWLKGAPDGVFRVRVHGRDQG
jgi:deazaflavin-dependent oxidoreductase (nitroreductase family)